MSSKTKSRTMVRKFISTPEAAETHVWEEVGDDGKTRQYCRGYASTFGVIDTDGEIIGRSAFDHVVDGGARVRFIRGHNHSGGAVGVFESFEITDKGLYFVARIIPTTEGKDLFIELESGALDSFSVGFYVAESRKRKASELKAEGVDTTGFSDDAEIVEFTKADLFEISAVLFPANAGATIGAKMSRKKNAPPAIRRPQRAKAEMAPGSWVSWHYEDGDLAYGIVREIMDDDVTLDNGDVLEVVEGDPVLRINVVEVSASGAWTETEEHIFAYASQVTAATEPEADDPEDGAEKSKAVSADLGDFLSGLRGLCDRLLTGDAPETESAKSDDTIDSILSRLR